MTQQEAITATRTIGFTRWYEKRIRDNNFGRLSVRAICEMDVEKNNGTQALLREAFEAGLRFGTSLGKQL